MHRQALRDAIVARDAFKVEREMDRAVEATARTLDGPLQEILTKVRNKAADQKIDDTVASHMLKAAAFDPDQPRDEKGQWTTGNGVIADRHGDQYDVKFNEERRTYNVTKANPLGGRDLDVASATMTRKEGAHKGEAVSSVQVHPEYQRRGIASALYDHIESHIGTKLKPNWATTPDGAALWKHRQSRNAAAKTDPVRFKFDETNPAAVAWIKAHGAELITDISETTRARVKDLVQDAFEDQFDVDELTGKIEDAVGDEDRAEMIARTETMRASNEGQQELWDQAVEQGVLTGRESQVWIITPDERLCPICAPLDGVEVTLGDTFDVDGEDIDGPPAHPNCRCTVGLVS